MRLSIGAAIIAALLIPANAQHNHGAGHSDYQGWASQLVGNCCDNRDCGSLKQTEHRETETGPQVLIDGEWCPVLKQHYVIRGKSPNWETPHACIRIKSPYSPGGCERLLCYMGAGGL
jgi:hypothetical protein